MVRGFPPGNYIISIHAPREGRDNGADCERLGARCISIHAPREGRDAGSRWRSWRRRNISIHAPREGRDYQVIYADGTKKISIHAPREGRDSKSEQISSHIFAKKAWIPDIFAQNAAFQSVLPLADRQKLLYLRCEPLRKFLRAFASHYKIIGSSGR